MVVITTNTRETRSESIDSASSTIDTTISNYDAKNAVPQLCLVPNKDTATGNIVMSTQFDLSSLIQSPVEDNRCREALKSIVILDDVDSPTVSSLLQKHEGKLMSIPSGILAGLRKAAPVNAFPGRVADFNDNLFYDMQDESLDIQSIIERSEENNVQEDDALKQDIANFEQALCDTLQDKHVSYRGSFMETEKTVFQPAHVDYEWEVLRENQKLFLAFFPLTEEGAFIQLWSDENQDKNVGTVVFIPYGKMLIVPSRTIHGGGFKRGPGGNLRFHLYLAVGDHCQLPKHQTNKYTEEQDRSKELCDRFVDSPGLDSLLGTFFD